MSEPDNALPTSPYILQDILGQGAMGEILNAKHRELKRQVAYKKILSQAAQDDEALRRFLREMQITAQLEHPNIIPVYEFEITEDQSLAYTMKLIKGQTLKDLITAKKQVLKSGKPLPDELGLDKFLEYFLSVCDAIHYAHTRGIIHRDLKPANIMIGPYHEVYVMDWGIARRMGKYKLERETERNEVSLDDFRSELDTEVSLDETRAGQILGTPRYMSPQQAAGKNRELDGRSDQFSLGLILFELLTLTPAFRAKDAISMLKKVLKVELQPFQPFSPQAPIPRELKAVVRKALGQKPDQRYLTVADMSQDIRRYQQGMEVEAEPDNLLQKIVRWMGHHRELTLAMVMLVILMSFGTIFLSLWNQQAALAIARQREARFHAVFAQVSQQAQKVDTHFLKMESIIRAIAAAAVQYIEQGQPSQASYYTPHPFLAPGQVESPLIGRKMSVLYPTTGFSPNKTMADMNGKLQKLLPMRHFLRYLALKSAVDNPNALTSEQAQQLIAVEGTPAMYTHFSLEEGVIYYFPGTGYDTEGYDARTRPFYKLSAHKTGIHWGSPYFDPLSGALLPSTTAMYDKQGKFLGVAGIDLFFRYVIDHLMTLPSLPQTVESYLLNQKGEIIIRSSDKDRNKKTESLSKGFETPPFPFTKLVQAVESEASGGHFEVQHQHDKAQERFLTSPDPSQSDTVLFYARLNTLGWYFVVRIPREVMQESKASS